MSRPIGSLRFPWSRQRDGAPFVGGNRVQLLVDGKAFFSELIAGIEKATRYVFLETYILMADGIGDRVAEALISAAARKVEVALAYDGYGSFGLDEQFVRRLQQAGVAVLEFRPMFPLHGHWPWSKRNHRKSLVVDGAIGIVGGLNISDDYAPKDQGGRGWRDTAVRIEGPSVAQLDAMFRRVWRQYGGSVLKSVPLEAEVFPEGREARFVGNFAGQDRREIRRDYLRAITGARTSIQITNAYFSPDRALLRSLKRAARRGVKVELIIAARTDVPPVLHASRSLYAGLLRAGVLIYEWEERVLHAKTAVVDGRWSTAGSANLNHRTHFWDLEVNATMLGPEVAGAFEDLFAQDRQRSREISHEAWSRRSLWLRIPEWIFGLFRRFM